jgi:hypothetical protein
MSSIDQAIYRLKEKEIVVDKVLSRTELIKRLIELNLFSDVKVRRSHTKKSRTNICDFV